MSTKLDANQVIKAVYDSSTQSLKTIPAAATSFSIELDASDGDSVAVRPMFVDVVTLQNNLSAGASNDSSNVDVSNYSLGSVVVNFSGLDAVDASISLQVSVDGSTFVTKSSQVLNSASGAKLFEIADAGYKYIRMSYVPNSVTTGNFTSKYTLKG